MIEFFRKLFNIETATEKAEKKVRAIIEELAKELKNDNNYDEIKAKAIESGKQLTIDEVKCVVYYFIGSKDDQNYSYETQVAKEIAVSSHICSGFGEEICPFIDNIAFSDDSYLQHHSQSYAIELLCRMALNDIRKEKTLELVRLHIEDFGDREYNLQSLSGFKNEPVVLEIYDSYIKLFLEDEPDYNGVLSIIAHLSFKNKEALNKYLPLLKHIIFKSSNKDYNSFSWGGVKKENADGSFEMFDNNSNKFSVSEGALANKIFAAIHYYNVDDNDPDVNTFLKQSYNNTNYEHHKKYIKDNIDINKLLE